MARCHSAVGDLRQPATNQRDQTALFSKNRPHDEVKVKKQRAEEGNRLREDGVAFTYGAH
jgi:hypothetical protein